MALRGVEEAAATGREGLKVVLEPIPGVTSNNLLGRNGLFLQAPPTDTFSHDHSFSHNDYETVGGIQFSRRGAKQLAMVTFDTLVVDWANWAFYNGSTIEEISAALIEICESGDPVLLTASHDLPPGGYGNWSLALAGPEVQMQATLRTLKVEERAGEGDARYLNLSFTEYRDPNISRLGAGRSGGKSLPTTVTLFMDGHATDAASSPIGNPPGDPVTLHMLAKRFYGDPSMWGTIARANRIKGWGGGDALVLYPGYQSMLKKGGGRTAIPGDWNKFRDVRIAKIKIPVNPNSKAVDPGAALGHTAQPNTSFGTSLKL